MNEWKRMKRGERAIIGLPEKERENQITSHFVFFQPEGMERVSECFQEKDGEKMDKDEGEKMKREEK